MSKYISMIIVIVLICCCGYFCLSQAILAGELKQRGLEHANELRWAIISFTMGVILGGVLYWVEEEF